MALVRNEPLALCGKTHVLIRLPKSRKRRAKFERIKMTVAIDPNTHIILSRSSQVLLRLYPKKVNNTNTAITNIRDYLGIIYLDKLIAVI